MDNTTHQALNTAVAMNTTVAIIELAKWLQSETIKGLLHIVDTGLFYTALDNPPIINLSDKESVVNSSLGEWTTSLKELLDVYNGYNELRAMNLYFKLDTEDSVYKLDNKRIDETKPLYRSIIPVKDVKDYKATFEISYEQIVSVHFETKAGFNNFICHKSFKVTTLIIDTDVLPSCIQLVKLVIMKQVSNGLFPVWHLDTKQ